MVVEKNILVSEIILKKNILENKLSIINANPNVFVENRKTELGDWINILPDRITKKGNISMKQYLSNLKKSIELDEDAFVELEKNKLIVAISKLDLEVLESQQR